VPQPTRVELEARSDLFSKPVMMPIVPLNIGFVLFSTGFHCVIINPAAVSINGTNAPYAYGSLAALA
jgi:hypothetical protein